ncbi:hypothetical protein ATCR1_06756 [Agrobacterium tumefaciens CCNWGS0286]|uniref:hypothetical protein n=1 Tax=Agrobacterium tumefaciens TaxID=358 RepID=UPI00023348A2|nr:hypothetical protein [Agrobacterium tumefaciens]EHH07546.1 hypothetical protein ATCR1_06756 [Agrobacterium tumefaciens CCNWGS0286]
MAVYVSRNGQMVDKATGEPMLTPEQRAAPVPVPMIISDIPEYRSPIDGRVISSRSERRDDLKRNGCVEYEPSMSPTKGKIRNKAFAAKRGLQVSEEFR